uniref:Uncharacterized protein n=1 Tax=Trichogramma kaykai TaxID=54128 RepID=A0ABD2WJE8_9HYME
MAQDDQKCSKQLKAMREEINWEIENERYKLLDQMHLLIENWKGQFPNLRDIFRSEEIDWLLSEASMNRDKTSNFFRLHTFTFFVINAGYKDEPKLDEDGKPLLRRTTAMHSIFKRGWKWFVDVLFRIYERFDVDYIDESGLTHFHLACMCGRYDIVEKFLVLGHDPNFMWQETGDSPLHLAVADSHDWVARSLLRHGADRNSINKNGLTPLHIICTQDEWHEFLVEIFFEVSETSHQALPLDVVDNFGQTPLQLAVANFLPDVVEILLDRGADLSGFVFPTEEQFDKSLKSFRDQNSNKLHFTANVLTITQRLEKGGCELDKSDALTIMKISAKLGLFDELKNLKKYWYDDEELVSEANKILMKPNLSLCDLIRMQPEESEKLLTYADYLKFSLSDEWFCISDSHRDACDTYLCEIMVREFFRRWTLEFFMPLTCYQLPILCCEKIIEKLKTEDLFHICLSASGQNNE